MTDDQFAALMAAVQPKPAPTVQVPVKPAIGIGAIELVFRALTGVCATGIGWLVITMPVMRENIKDLKVDVSRIEENTQDRFTRQDFETEIQALVNEVRRNSSNLSERKDFMEQTRERLTRIEQKMEDRK